MARIFRPEPMGLDENLFQLGLDRRISLDADRDTLFLNFEGMRVRNRAQRGRDPFGRRSPLGPSVIEWRRWSTTTTSASTRT